MDSARQTAIPQGAEFAAALNRLWSRFLPEIEQRLAVLESAATAAAKGTLAPQQQETAHAAAHKLAGVLGSFGLDGGTSPARETELLYSSQAAPDPGQAQLLVQLASSLRALIETRKQAQAPAQ
jgi:HPt (histidine-containing phosphotransfer) domain-containing protein